MPMLALFVRYSPCFWKNHIRCCQNHKSKLTLPQTIINLRAMQAQPRKIKTVMMISLHPQTLVMIMMSHIKIEILNQKMKLMTRWRQRLMLRKLENRETTLMKSREQLSDPGMVSLQTYRFPCFRLFTLNKTYLNIIISLSLLSLLLYI